MKRTSGIVYNPQKKKWDFTIENDEYQSYVMLEKTDVPKFLIIPLDRSNYGKPMGNMEEKVKNSHAYQEAIHQIVSWEEKMKNRLEIEEIAILGNETMGDKQLTIFGLCLTNPVPELPFSLEKKKEEYDTQIQLLEQDKEKKTYFAIALEKVVKNNQIYFQCSDHHVVPISKKRINEGSVSLNSLFYYATFTGTYAGSTHRTFKEDLVQLINEEPSIRVKKLLL